MNDVSEYEWDCITDQASFAPRDGAGALVFKDHMWLLGGWNPSDKINFPRTCNSEIWCSSDGLEWGRMCAEAPWEGRHTAGYAIHNERMWIIGGDCNQGHYQPDVWSSPDGRCWDRVVDETPWGRRALHHTVAFADSLWVMGGQTLPQFAPAEEAFFNDVWRSVDGSIWEQATSCAPWAPRGMIGHSAVFRDRIWLLGGGTYETPDVPKRQFLNDVWSTADGIDWMSHAPAPWMPRQYHDVAVWDDRLWVLEGVYNAAAQRSMVNVTGDWNRNDVWYSSDGESWCELADTPWSPRHAASPFVFDDALWMVTGNNMSSDVWKLVRRM